MVDEILLDSDGRIEYYTDPVDQEDQLQDDQEDQLQDDQEDQLQDDQEDQLQDDFVQTVQEDQYLQLLKSIDNKLGDLENDNIGNTKTFQDAVVSSGNDIVGLSDNSTVVISDNIIEKPINNYNTTESFLLFIVISIVIGCLAFIIKRSVFRWN